MLPACYAPTPARPASPVAGMPTRVSLGAWNVATSHPGCRAPAQTLEERGYADSGYRGERLGLPPVGPRIGGADRPQSCWR